jgi:hypothetical protein
MVDHAEILSHMRAELEAVVDCYVSPASDARTRAVAKIAMAHATAYLLVRTVPVGMGDPMSVVRFRIMAPFTNFLTDVRERVSALLSSRAMRG